MTKIISYEVENGILKVETTGDLQYMGNSELVLADFGQFERTGNGTVLYTAEVFEGEHDYDTEYADDLKHLKQGGVRKVY